MCLSAEVGSGGPYSYGTTVSCLWTPSFSFHLLSVLGLAFAFCLLRREYGKVFLDISDICASLPVEEAC